MLENPLVRFQGSAVALASLPAIEIFGSIEQRPSPAIFMVMLVTRVDEILGYDVSRHFQSGEITVKLASSVVTEVRPPFLADESCFLVEELSVHTWHFLHNFALDFVELAHARQSSSKLGFALA